MRRTSVFVSALALFLGFASLLTAGPIIHSGGATPGGIRVTDTSLSPEGSWSFGTFVLRLRLDNSQPFPQDVSCTINNTRFSSSVRIPAGGSATLAIPVPSVGGGAVYTCAIQDAKGVSTFQANYSLYSSAHGSSYNGYHSLYGFDEPMLYLSSSLSSDNVKDGFKAHFTSLSSGSGYSSSSFTAPGYRTVYSSDNASTLKATEVADPWPADWRCYSPFGACLIADRDYGAIPENGKEALREYVSAGGNVFLVGAKDECQKIVRAFTGNSLQDMLVNVAPGEKEAFFHYGLGSIGYVVATDYATFATSAPVKDWYPQAMERLRDAKSVFNASFIGTISRNPFFKIDNSGRERIPSRLFIVLLLAFVILAGPVAIRVLAKKNKRIWLFWVLPAISLVFSAAIICSMLVSEGVKPSSTRDAVTFLGQGDGRAVTVGGISVYTPLSLSGLDFKNDSDVLPFSGNGEIVAGKTLRYGAGWVRPRIPGVFAVRRTDLLRERVEVTKADDGTIEIVNALGAPLKSITLWDENGSVHTAENVASGAKVKLNARLEAPEGVKARVNAAFNSKWAYHGLEYYEIGKPVTTSLQGDVATVNYKCLYAAETDGTCPFLDDPLAGRKHLSEDSALVIGSYGFRSAEKGGANQ